VRTVFRNSEIPGRIHALQPFLSVGKIEGGVRVWSGHSGPAISLGHLPAQFHESARSAVYVVYSYETPIGWVTEHEGRGCREVYRYHIPDVGYSPTTGQHQYTLLEEWSAPRRRQGCRKWEMDGRRIVVRLPATAEAYGTPRRPRSGGVDGLRPGDVIGRASRRSAYEGTGEDASHWSPDDWRQQRADRPGYRHPAHP